jgi:HK97 family phage major capsid protein
MAVDISRQTTNVLLPPAVSQEIWKNMQHASVVQQMVPRIQIPAGGLDIPIITGDPTPEWVGETDEKPVSRPTLGTKYLKAYKMAVIVPFSNEFRRDLSTLYSALVERLPLTLARKFDRTVLGFESSPGTGFDTLAGVPTASLTSGSVYDGYVSALEAVATGTEDGSADVERWVLSSQAEIAALGAKDLQDRPIFIDSVTAQGSVSREILARPVSKTPHVYHPGTAGSAPATLGFGGQWSSAMWGFVEDLRVDVSEEATINDGGTQLNLWQRNMFATRVEFEIGFALRDENRFVRLTGDVPSAGS